MMYTTEYKEAKGNKVRFAEIMRASYPHLKDATILRRWYDLKKELGDNFNITQQEPKLYYENEYRITSNKKAFERLVKQQSPHLKDSTLKRYYSRLKRFLGEQKAIEPFETDNKIIQDVKHKPEPKYLAEDKSEPRHMKMLEWKDIKKFGYDKKMSRQQLMKYGFTTQEINWLVDEGEYEEKSKYPTKSIAEKTSFDDLEIVY